jgi:prepilin peptidase CpaA
LEIVNELSPDLRVFLAVFVLAAGTFDLLRRRIPNWLTLGGILAALLLHVVGNGMPGLWFSVRGMALGFGVYLLLYLLHAMGGGDVKLMGAVGALVGPWNWLIVFLTASILGGVFAIVLIAARGRLGETISNIGFLLRELLSLRAPHKGKEELDVSSGKGLSLPHGTVIAVASLAWLIIQWRA